SLFFCDFHLHHQAPHHPLQLGDPILVLAPLAVSLEEVFQAFEGDLLPAGDEPGLQRVLAGDLGLTLPGREDFGDGLGLGLGREGSASALGHRRTLLRWPALTSVLVQSQGRTSPSGSWTPKSPRSPRTRGSRMAEGRSSSLRVARNRYKRGRTRI